MVPNTAASYMAGGVVSLGSAACDPRRSTDFLHSKLLLMAFWLRLGIDADESQRPGDAEMAIPETQVVDYGQETQVVDDGQDQEMPPVEDAGLSQSQDPPAQPLLPADTVEDAVLSQAQVPPGQPEPAESVDDASLSQSQVAPGQLEADTNNVGGDALDGPPSDDDLSQAILSELGVDSDASTVDPAESMQQKLMDVSQNEGSSHGGLRAFGTLSRVL